MEMASLTFSHQAHRLLTLCIPGLTAPAGNCTAGHYCTLSSTQPNPISQAFGDYCLAGHYCPTGTGTPVPCPSGTYLPDTGRASDLDCLDCPGGYYCDSAGMNNVTGEIVCLLSLSLIGSISWCRVGDWKVRLIQSHGWCRLSDWKVKLIHSHG